MKSEKVTDMTSDENRKRYEEDNKPISHEEAEARISAFQIAMQKLIADHRIPNVVVFIGVTTHDTLKVGCNFAGNSGACGVAIGRGLHLIGHQGDAGGRLALCAIDTFADENEACQRGQDAMLAGAVTRGVLS